MKNFIYPGTTAAPKGADKLYTRWFFQYLLCRLGLTIFVLVILSGIFGQRQWLLWLYYHW